MKLKHAIIPAALAGLLAAIAGCGTGSTSNQPVSNPAGGRGKIQLKIAWPPLPTKSTRLIPAASQSIGIVVTQKGSNVANYTAPRPSGGYPSPTIVELDVPTGDLTEAITAYPTPDATGIAQAAATVNVTVGTDTLINTVTLNSTITKVELTPTSATATAGGASVQFAAAAEDAAGNLVLTVPGNFSWSLDNAGIANLAANGASATLAPTGGGTAHVTVTESESGVVSTAAVVTITGAPPPPVTYSVFVADASNSRIVGMDGIPAKTFTTYDDSKSGTKFYDPQSVALDSQGRIYICDYEPGASKIVRIDDITGKNRVVYAPAGSTASIVYVDKAGHIYFRDDHGAINRIDDMTGANLVTFGGGTNNPLGNPSGIAVDSKNRIYIFDGSSQLVRFDDMTGKNLIKFGSYGSGVNQFNVNVGFGGGGIAIDSTDHIYIADSDNHRMVRIDDADSGTNWTAFNIPAVGSTAVRPFDVAVTGGANPAILFLDNVKSLAFTMSDMTGANLQSYGSSGTGTGQFRFPIGIAAK